MSENVTVAIKLDDLVKIKGDLARSKAMAELITVYLKSAENALEEKDGVIERLSYTISATDDAANNEIDYLQRKNQKLKKKLKTWKKYAKEMEGAAMFGEMYEGIKCARAMPLDFPEFMVIRNSVKPRCSRRGYKRPLLTFLC